MWLGLTHTCFANALDIGQYDNPRDFTLRITDPFPPENENLVQPVVGYYSIKILPPGMEDVGINDNNFKCEGLFFKQRQGIIYIDVRKPPSQTQAGRYDLSVILSLPDEGNFQSRQAKALQYFDSNTDVILLLDNSRSMYDNDPKNLRYHSAASFIRLASLSDKVHKVALVKFSSAAKLMIPWTSPGEIRNIDSILTPGRTGNFTNINQALDYCSHLFEDSLAHDRVLVLLTDGHNEPGRYQDAHLQLADLGVRLITIGLSKQADHELLQTMADDTGGSYFEAVDDARLLGIYNQIASEISDFKSMKDILSGGLVEFTCLSADELINIELTGFEQKTAKFTLTDPAGRNVDVNSIIAQSMDEYLLLRLMHPRAGKWSLKNSGGPFRVKINSKTSLFPKLFPLEKKYLQHEIAHFAISLAQHEDAILQAKVVGRIRDSQNAIEAEVILYDDGVHGDNHADDGVYCAIYPMDLPVGLHQLEVVAQGKDANGQEFTRYTNGSFHVLQAAETSKDFFMASVLPLYLDLGKIEAGSSKSANLRLSFQGRNERLIAFRENNPMRHSSIDFQLKPEQLNFPEDGKLQPTLPAIYQIGFVIPQDAPEGKYSGTIGIYLGDQLISMPVDFEVITAKLKKEKILPDLTQTELPRIMELESLDREIVPDITAKTDPETLPLSLQPSSSSSPGLKPLALPKPKAPASTPVKADEPSTPSPLAPPPPVTEFAYRVEPSSLQIFDIAAGQSAEQLIRIINISSSPGSVAMRLEGPGTLAPASITLEPGETRAFAWQWTPRLLESDAGSIFLHHSAKNIPEQSLELHWTLRGKSHWLLTVALTMFLLMAIVYGLEYRRNHQSQDYYLSLCSLIHIALILIARVIFIPLPPEPKDLPVIQVDLIAENEDLEEKMIPERDIEFVENLPENQELLSSSQDNQPQKVETAINPIEAAPELVDSTLISESSPVEMQVTLNPREAQNELQPISLNRLAPKKTTKTRERADRQNTPSYVTTKVQSQLPDRKTENPLENSAELLTSRELIPLPAENIIPRSEREFEKIENNRIEKPIEIESKNDRPTHRSTLQQVQAPPPAIRRAPQFQLTKALDNIEPGRKLPSPTPEYPNQPVERALMPQALPDRRQGKVQNPIKEPDPASGPQAADLLHSIKISDNEKLKATQSVRHSPQVGLSAPQSTVSSSKNPDAAGEVVRSTGDQTLRIEPKSHQQIKLPTAGKTSSQSIQMNEQSNQISLPETETIIQQTNLSLKNERVQAREINTERNASPQDQKATSLQLEKSPMQPAALSNNKDTAIPIQVSDFLGQTRTDMANRELVRQSTSSGHRNDTPMPTWNPDVSEVQSAGKDITPEAQVEKGLDTEIERIETIAKPIAQEAQGQDFKVQLNLPEEKSAMEKIEVKIKTPERLKDVVERPNTQLFPASPQAPTQPLRLERPNLRRSRPPTLRPASVGNSTLKGEAEE